MELRGTLASSNVSGSGGGGLILNPSGTQSINGMKAGNGMLQKLNSGTTSTRRPNLHFDVAA